MFIGAINHKLRAFFWKVAPILEGREVYIGCSGNFTIEQIISRQCKGAVIHSNDISLYSSLVGEALMNQVVDVEVTESEWMFLEGGIKQGGAQSISAVLLMMEMLKFEKRRNAFQERMWTHYLRRWDELMAKTAETVEKALAAISIKEYTMVDVHDYFPAPPGAVAIGFLPTYVGGYEKLYERVEQVLKWTPPNYELLTEERREESVRRMTESDYILYDDRRREDLPCVAQVDQFGKKAVYIYSNLPFEKGLFRRTVGERIAKYRILAPAEEIPAGAEIKIAKTDNGTIQHYRNMYLKKGIECASGDLCYLVFVGGALFGFLIFKCHSKMGKRGDVYLLSDFVVVSKRHKRLSKLLLMVSLTEEMRVILEEAMIDRVVSVSTTAFTRNAVSMKYRGIYKLLKRGDGFLNYGADFTETKLKEVLGAWMKRFNK